MPCHGCKETQKAQRSDRQRLDAKVMAALSEAVAATRATNPDLSTRLMALVGEINAQTVKESIKQ
jgi:hypothetical protein